MTGQKLVSVDIGSISTIQGVLNSLLQLDGELNSSGLGHFGLFNKAYQVVTLNIQQAVADNYFENPEFIEKFIICFSGYYFRVINHSVQKNRDVPAPWSKLNEYATTKSSPVFISLMLGANAHITNDLAQVLNTLMQDESAEELLGDFVKIDKLLMKSGKEIIGLFEENNAFLNFLKRRFEFMYYRPAMYTILSWRVRAWKDYCKLKAGHTSVLDITARSARTADRLLRLSTFLG